LDLSCIRPDRRDPGVLDLVGKRIPRSKERGIYRPCSGIRIALCDLGRDLFCRTYALSREIQKRQDAQD